MMDRFGIDHEALNAELYRLQASDRVRARKKLKTAPNTLTDYELQILGLEYEPAPRTVRPSPPSPSPPSQRDLVTVQLRPKGIIFRTPFLESLNNHAIELAVQHNLRVERCAPDDADAAAESRLVRAPAICNERDYATFLHEVAHVIEPTADSRQFPNRINRGSLVAPGGEVGAWRWALVHALRWTVEMQQNMFESLRSYAPHATPDERESMRMLLMQASLHMRGPSWTFKELEDKCASLSGCQTVSSGVPDRARVALAIRRRIEGMNP